MSRPFVLLDRDGVIIEERIYLADPAGVALVPGAGLALKELAGLGCGLVVITNQAGVGRGFFDGAALDRVHARLAELLANEGVRLDGIYVCPHHPNDGCACRKPKTGLLEQARREHGFDPAKSFVVGDKAIDVEFGKNAGATTLLVRTGYGREVEAAGRAGADYVVDDLPAVAAVIRSILAPASQPQ